MLLDVLEERDWETTFATWAAAPSRTEQERCENAASMVRNAVAASGKLKGRDIKVIVHGSFRNRVNVPGESDVDIGVVCFDSFHPVYPEGVTAGSLGHGDATYSYARFKDEIDEALGSYFGRAAVKRGRKTFDVRETSYHVEADVTPFFEHRRYVPYQGSYTHLSGLAMWPDDGGIVINWPEQHYENGVEKNERTKRGYKGLVRILKSLRNEMDAAGFEAAKAIPPGFVVECLVWNIPDECFIQETWDKVVQAGLLSLWSNMREDATCSEWGEVSELKYLFRNPKWSREQAHAFVDAAWDYVGIR